MTTVPETTVEQRSLNAPKERTEARYVRDRQWDALERIAEQNPLYICWWSKGPRARDLAVLPGYLGACSLTDQRMMAEMSETLGLGLGLVQPPDLRIFNFIDGLNVLRWLNDHPDWTRIGEWCEERLAAPVWITDAGRAALADREPYDLEPVHWGLDDRGWHSIPAVPLPFSDGSGRC